MIASSKIPDLKIRGTGSVCAPELTEEMLDLMMRRADAVEDQTTKSDLFLLILEVRKLREAKQ